MKKVLIILFLFISLVTSAATYYVSTTGDNGNAGTIGAPWATWVYGMQQLNAGDTLYLRGGTYTSTALIAINDSNTDDGTAENPIVVLAYPGDEERPILDCSGLNSTSGFSIRDKDYWKFKGFEVRDAHDTDGTYTNIYGIALRNCDEVYLENIIVHDIDGTGFLIENSYVLYFRNCDSYNNYDPYNDGGKADGFRLYSNTITDFSCKAYFDKCRAWNNSDDGWDLNMLVTAVVDSCWAWGNGYDTDGSGEGIKGGQNYTAYPPPSEQYIVTNNVSVYNRGGFRDNSNESCTQNINARWYNNVAAFNSIRNWSGSRNTGAAQTQILRNNISYSSPVIYWFEPGTGEIHDHNSWDIPLTLTDADFVSVDTTGITAPRQADGSLPDNACYNNFLKLSDASQAINRGIDVGFSYIGDAPDLGPFEWSDYDAPPPLISTLYPPVINSNQITTGGFIIEDYDETIVWKGVCWNTTGNPSDEDDRISGGTGSDPYTVIISGLLANTTYYIRAYAITESGTGYGNIYEITTDKWNYLKHDGKIVTHGGKPVIVR